MQPENIRRSRLENTAIGLKNAWRHQVDEAAFQTSLASHVVRETVKETFFDVALSYQGQFFIENAGFITSLSNVIANFLLGSRFLPPAIAFYAQEPGWMLNNVNEKIKRGDLVPENLFSKTEKRHPAFGGLLRKARRGTTFLAPHGKKIAGTAAFSGSLLFLGYSAYAVYFQNDTTPLVPLAISNLPGMVQSLSAVFENQANALSERLKETKNPLLKWIVAPVTKNPMVYGTLADFGGTSLFIATEARGAHALLMVPIGLLLLNGDHGIFWQDKNLLAAIEREKAKREKLVSPANFVTYARHGVTRLAVPA